jgi:hypothetical protein
MSTKPLYDWTDKELAERVRIYPDGNDPRLTAAPLGRKLSGENV